jgi:hypothetical protein
MPDFFAEEAFTVAMPDGRTYNVPRGKSDLPADVADHPFVKAHAVGIPKGRMPLVEGVDHDGNEILIEADEAGQKVTPVYSMIDPLRPPSRQEGPTDWHRSPAAAEFARQNAEAVGAPVLPFDAAVPQPSVRPDPYNPDRDLPQSAAPTAQVYNAPRNAPRSASGTAAASNGGNKGASTGTTAPNDGGKGE